MRAAVFVEQDAPFVVEEMRAAPVRRRRGRRAHGRRGVLHHRLPHAARAPARRAAGDPRPQRGRRGRAGGRARRARARRRAGDRPGDAGVRPLLLLPAASLRPVRPARRRAAAVRRDAGGRHRGPRGRDGDLRGADQGAGGVRVRRGLRPARRAARAHGVRGRVGAGRGHARGRGAAGLVRGRRRLRAPGPLDDPGRAGRRRRADHRRRAAPRAQGAGGRRWAPPTSSIRRPGTRSTTSAR